MRSHYEIYMDFNRAIGQANKLRAIASRVRTLANDDLGGTLTAIGNNWTGENSEAFIAKGNTLKGKIAVTAGDLERVAAAIERIATNTRNAELKAIEIARTSGSGGGGGKSW